MSTLNQDVVILKREVSKLKSQVENLERLLPKTVPSQREVDLPEHLYKTYHALKAISGEATAQQVAVRSGRARAVESAYLNFLAISGVVNKLRVHRVVLFQLPQKEAKK